MGIHKILLIDDEIELNEGIAYYLQKEGYEVYVARNGFHGLLKLKEVSDIDLVITDILMPEKDGLEVVMEVEGKKNHPKIIAISGGGRFNAADYLDTAQKLGVDKTLQKPFSMRELLSAIQEI
ncbi:MAG: response regulator transcription factor [Bacteroidota bacterium]